MDHQEFVSADQKDARDREVNCLGKLTWKSREEAIAASAYSAWQYGDGQDRPAPYRCKHCGKWHLSRTYSSD